MTIIKSETNSSSEKFSAHLANGVDNESVCWFEHYEIAADAPEDALRTLLVMGRGRPIKHYSISPSPKCKAWSDAQWDRAWQVLEEEFRLRHVPHVRVRHVKKRSGADVANAHEHKSFPSINPVTGKVLRFSHEYSRQEKVARILEFEFGEPLNCGKHNKAVIAALINDGRVDIANAMIAVGLVGKERPSATRTHAEHQQAKRTRSTPEDDRGRIWDAWEALSDEWSVQDAFEARGMVLAAGDKAGAFVVVMLSGAVHEVGRALKAHAKAHKLVPPRAKDILAQLETVPGLPTVSAAKQRIRTLDHHLGDNFDEDIAEFAPKKAGRDFIAPEFSDDGVGEPLAGHAMMKRRARGVRQDSQGRIPTNNAATWESLLQALFKGTAIGHAVASMVSLRDGRVVDVRLRTGETLHAEGDEVSVDWTGERVSDAAVAAFVAMVRCADWPGVELSGDADWCRRAAIALTVAGVPVTNRDLRDLVARHQRPAGAANTSLEIQPAMRPKIALSPEEKVAAVAGFEDDARTYSTNILGGPLVVTVPNTVQDFAADMGNPSLATPGSSLERRDTFIEPPPREHAVQPEPLSGEPESEEAQESLAAFKERVRRAGIVGSGSSHDATSKGPKVRLKDRFLFRPELFRSPATTPPSSHAYSPSRKRERDEN